MLYPLRFKPIYKSPVWGGNQIALLPGRKGMPATCGESWEISTVKDNVSVVAEGPLKGNTLEELIEVYMGDLVGEKVYQEFGMRFPLLVKIIDAKSDLSVQVHPDDEYAWEHHRDSGKTEMWYVMKTAKNARIINGFTKAVNTGDVSQHITQESLNEILRDIPADLGQVHFIPAGRVHAIGGGVMLAEIQQCSDITYRLYDWGRKDEKGNSRPLHIDQALKVLDFSDRHDCFQPKQEKGIQPLASCNYFTCNLLSTDSELRRDYEAIDSFVILLCTEGRCRLETRDQQPILIEQGQTLLIPAVTGEIVLIAENDCKILECYIE